MFLYNKKFNFSGFIYGQKNGAASKLKFGNYYSSYNGCGWVATYNALLILNKKIHPACIIRFYETRFSFVNGLSGIRINAVVSYFKKAGYKVSKLYNSKRFDNNAKKASVSILWYSNKWSAHYVAIKWEGKGNKFIVYNESCTNTTSTKYKSILDINKNIGGSVGVLITIK